MLFAWWMKWRSGPAEAGLDEMDLEVYDDVMVERDGARIYGTVGEIRGGLVEVVPFDGAEPVWVDWHEVRVL